MKSWDVQPRPRRAPQARAPEPAPVVAVRRRAAPLPKTPLKERRRKQRTLFYTVLAGTVVVLTALSFYLIWLPALRISVVEVSGPHADEVRTSVQNTFVGTYAYLIPKNSIFFFPKERARLRVLSEHPDISAVAFSRTSFHSVAVVGTPRTAALTWCGALYESEPLNCYDADIEGLIFAPSTGIASSSGALRVFAPLSQEPNESGSPVGLTVDGAGRLPDALRFVKAIRELGVPISGLALRGDEADLRLPSGARITYVLGREREAAQLAASALPNVPFSSGTIQYVDLRFSGKVYVKKTEGEVE